MSIEMHALEHNSKREINLLRIICMLGAILSVVVTIVWRYLYSGSEFLLNSHSFIYAGIFFVLFIGIFTLSYKNEFVRRNAYIFVNAIFYSATLIVIYAAKVDKFGEKPVLLILLIFFATVLVLKKISHLLIYLSTMGTLTLVVLYNAEETILTKGNIALFVVLFFIVTLVNMKYKIYTQEEIEAKEENYRKLVEMAPLGIVIHKDGIVLYANPVFYDMMKLSSEDNIVGKQLVNLIKSDYGNDMNFGFGKSFIREKIDFVEKSLILLDGTTIEVEVDTIEVEYFGKRVFMCLFRDITDRKRAEKKLVEAESRYRGLIESTLVGVFLYTDKFMYVNPYLEELLDYSKEELYNMTIYDIVHPEDRYIIGQYKQNGLTTNARMQFRILKRDKSIVFVEAHAAETIYDGRPTIIVTLLDISHIKKTEEKIKYIAYHDSLTGLPNRYMLNDYIDKAISSNAAAGPENTLGVMLVDLDRFKVINDSLGHSFGDMVLKEAAKRLKNCIGEKDIVFRYGGDEFVILLPDADIRKCAETAKNISNAFRHPFIINEQRTFSTISIGISLFPEDGDNAETLIKNADMAMYVVKDIGRNNYQFYHESFNKELLRKMELENGLRKALENNEFALYYQPQIDLNSGKIVGLEALIRWHHPEYGLVYPAEFISLAEETGLIVPIGKWVLETACRQNKSWQEMGVDFIPVAVNVSAYQILHSDLSSIVSEVLDKTKLDPQCLILEITESIMQDIEKTSRIISDLKSFNVKVAIDDFGTGYSSISLLKDLKFDILKIDPSFTFELKNDKNSIDLIKLIIDFACQRSYSIIAEGIEDEEQAKILAEKGCNWGQGFYYSEPIPAESIKEFLNESASMLDVM